MEAISEEIQKCLLREVPKTERLLVVMNPDDKPADLFENLGPVLEVNVRRSIATLDTILDNCESRLVHLTQWEGHFPAFLRRLDGNPVQQHGGAAGSAGAFARHMLRATSTSHQAVGEVRRPSNPATLSAQL